MNDKSNCQTGREGDWPLYLVAVREMMPLLFATGHYNYARYGIFYIRSTEIMPVEIRSHFLKGDHAMHHSAGIFYGLWSGMAIESTFVLYDMRYGRWIATHLY